MDVQPAHSLNIQRMWQMPISALCLVVPACAIQLGCKEHQIAALLPMTVYCLYTVCAAVVLTILVVRLYTMHGIRRFAFDIAVWFLGAALLALPLGAATTFANWLIAIEARIDPRAIPTLRMTLAACFYLELIPVFFVTEGVMAFAAVVVRKLRA